MDRLFNWPVFWVMMVLALFPIAWPYLAYVEGNVFPVVGKIRVSERVDSTNVVSISGSIEIMRSNCITESIVWVKGNDRLGAIYKLEPHKLVDGDIVSFGPWRIYGISDMEGVRANIIHECHSLWDTVTRLYP